MAKIVNENEFDNCIKEGVVVVDFFANWCGPCKMLAPVFEELSQEMEGKAEFIKVDVDEYMELAGRYQVTNIPAVIILKDGEKVDSFVGFSPKDVIREKVNKYI